MQTKLRIVYRQKLYKFLNEKFCEFLCNTIVNGFRNLPEDDIIFMPTDFTVTVTKGSKVKKDLEVLCEFRFTLK